MRLYHLLKQDIKYQVRYGFYLIYLVVAIIYISVLRALPTTLLKPSLIFIVFSDPAALGFFFIGGIVLLEREERLQQYHSILPISRHAYIVSKVVSLSFIATIAAILIGFFALFSNINYLLLGVGTFLGALVFTLLGFIVATFSDSLNQYFMQGLPIGIILIAPGLFILFGKTHFLIEVLPAALLIKLLRSGIDNMENNLVVLRILGLLIWGIIAYFVAYHRYGKYLSQGEK